MVPFHVIVLPDKIQADITVGDATFTLDTQEVDSLMRRLIEVRPLMLPNVGIEPLPPPTPMPIVEFRYHVDPNYKQGGAFLHLTHPALGWLTWNATAHTARHFGFRALDQTVPGIPPPNP